METASVEWARYRGAKVNHDVALNRWRIATAELEDSARDVRVTLQRARDAQRLEDEVSQCA
jgi:hypothetical protein